MITSFIDIFLLFISMLTISFRTRAISVPLALMSPHLLCFFSRYLQRSHICQPLLHHLVEMLSKHPQNKTLPWSGNTFSMFFWKTLAVVALLCTWVNNELVTVTICGETKPCAFTWLPVFSSSDSWRGSDVVDRSETPLAWLDQIGWSTVDVGKGSSCCHRNATFSRAVSDSFRLIQTN